MQIGVIDFFAGCGGASLGFLEASKAFSNVSIIGGIDNDHYACQTYLKNVKKPAYELDIAELVKDPASLKKLSATCGLASFDRLVLIGCSPCQGFAAHRKSSGGEDSRRNLFVDLCTIIARLRPHAFFIENVPDLVSEKHWPYFQQGINILLKSGYSVDSRIYNFAEIGLPQERFRIVLVGTRMGAKLKLPQTFLKQDKFVTVRDAIGHLSPLRPGESSAHDPMHKTSKHRASTVAILRKVPKDGGNRPPGVGPECLDRARVKFGGYTDVYGRLSWGKPSVTITARCRTPSCGRFAHPEQDRGLSIREAALLQGFPKDFIIDGPFDDAFKQIGNAVAPTVAKFFATEILSHVINETIPRRVTPTASGIQEAIGPGFAVKIAGIKRLREAQLAT